MSVKRFTFCSYNLQILIAIKILIMFGFLHCGDILFISLSLTVIISFNISFREIEKGGMMFGDICLIIKGDNILFY